jgi:predicted phage terminase large subunit-like protein
LHQHPSKKRYQVGDGSLETDSLAKEKYYREFLFSECRPVAELIPLWQQYKEKHQIFKFEDWLAKRDRARKDNYHLGKLLGHDFYEHVHREMCSFYVQKNFDGVYKQEYTLADLHNGILKHHRLREQEMMLLAPRGAFKSTTNMVDCVSWIINCPDIRIMILSGEYKLAQKFMLQVKGYFYLPEDAAPSQFQQLFPEFIIQEDLMTMTPLTTPARVISQEGTPTLWVNSIGSSLSGWHCDILKGDDVVTDENSNSEETREKVNEKWTGAYNLLDEWGFVDNIGTRYFPSDVFGERLKLQDKLPLKFLRRQAWTVKEEYQNLKLEELQEHQVELYFPEKISFKSLRDKLLRNKTQFLCQQLNLPAGGDDLLCFEEDKMRAAHLDFWACPQSGDVFICFDTSSGSQSGDYSAGAVGRIKDEELYVLEVLFGKWKPSELSMQIVAAAAKWNPKTVLIEDWPGSELVKREINTLATARGLRIPLHWIKRDMSPNAKKNRIRGLEILLNDERLFFANGTWTDELMKQYTRYTGDKVRRRHDDIPDACSFLQKFMADSNDAVKQEVNKKPPFPAPMSMSSLIGNTHTPKPSVIEHTNSIDQQFFGGMNLYRN